MKLFSKLKLKIESKLRNYLISLGFMNIHYPIIWGDEKRVILGKNVGLNNAILNTRSGKIVLEDNVYCGHNVLLLTGRHIKSLVPDEGYDIYVGEGTWLASGSIILGGVRIGKNCVVGAGAVVTKDVPDNCFVAGVPAKIIRRLNEK